MAIDERTGASRCAALPPSRRAVHRHPFAAGGSGARPAVLVAGAGVAGLEFSLRLAELAPGRAEVTLLSPEDAFTYRPFTVAETFSAGPAFRLPLDRLAGDAGATWRGGGLVSVDRRAHVAYTARGEALAYDLLVVAAGARQHVSLLGALTFRGEHDEPAFRALLADLRAGRAGSLAFVVPPGPGWPPPLYELALMTAAELGGRARLVLVTPERAPLERFGAEVSDTVAEQLDAAGIEVHCGRYAAELADGSLRLVPELRVAVEHVVALPRLRGPYIAGLRCNHDGFLRADRHSLVLGFDDVWAVGDTTSFPLKHGVIAVQQADAAAQSVAARLGVRLRPAPFRPVLRGLLLTGDTPRFPSAGAGPVPYHPLFWPPSRLAGGRLARYLASCGLPVPEPPAVPEQLAVALDLEAAESASALLPV